MSAFPGGATTYSGHRQASEEAAAANRVDASTQRPSREERIADAERRRREQKTAQRQAEHTQKLRRELRTLSLRDIAQRRERMKAKQMEELQGA